jgi:hypothetical protein
MKKIHVEENTSQLNARVNNMQNQILDFMHNAGKPKNLNSK